MVETKDFEIDGNKYTITQMTARKAIRMQAKLIKIFGSPLAEIFLSNSDKNLNGLEFSKDSAVNAIKNLSFGLDENIFDNLIMELLKGVRKDGVELTDSVIDLEFAGKLDTLFKVVWAVLEHNYGFFFKMIETK